MQKLATKVKPLMPLQVEAHRQAPSPRATGATSILSGTARDRLRRGVGRARPAAARVPAGAGTAARSLPARRGLRTAPRRALHRLPRARAITTASTRTRRCSKPHPRAEALRRRGQEPHAGPDGQLRLREPRSDVRLHVGAVGLHPPPAEQHHPRRRQRRAGAEAGRQVPRHVLREHGRQEESRADPAVTAGRRTSTTTRSTTTTRRSSGSWTGRRSTSSTSATGATRGTRRSSSSRSA